MLYIVMGVAGCGKTTVGRELARQLGVPFHDADDYHCSQSIEKMRAGKPLTDEDRQLWLQRLALLIQDAQSTEGAVLACSALKASYRSLLTGNGMQQVQFIHLTGYKDTLLTRLNERKGHYFPSALLEDQLSILEAPCDAITVSAELPIDTVLQEIVEAMTTRGLHA